MRLIVARCSVEYEGRLGARLPPAQRLILLKADGSIAVHADSKAYKPLNWMSPPCTIREEPSAILATNPNQADRAAAFHEYHKIYQTNVNTYAALYNSILQRDWFHSQARGYRSTLEAALHGNNIPTAVVTNLIETTNAGTEPLRRYHRLRKRVLGLPSPDGAAPNPPLVLRLDDVVVRISGRIDRVDVAELGDGLGFWIIDYKTGRSQHYTGAALAVFLSF